MERYNYTELEAIREAGVASVKGATTDTQAIAMTAAASYALDLVV